MPNQDPRASMSRDMPVALIDPDPAQPRKHFDHARIEELAASMSATGLAVPILVRPVGDRFVIVHGERRWRAARLLGWDAIPAEVRDLTPGAAGWLSLVENVQRSDLTPIEEAAAFRVRLDAGMTQAELGRRIGKSQSYVAQKLRLLTLPPPVAGYLARGELSEGHGRELLRFRGFYGEAGPRARLPWSDEASSLISRVVTDPGPDVLVAWPWTAMRPLDCPPCWGWPHRKEKSPALIAGCRDMLTWLDAERGDVPAWTITAWWYATAAADRSLSVADLSRLVDNWRNLILSAVVWQTIEAPPEPPDPADRLRWLMYWHYLSDLRHAGYDVRNLPKSLVEAAAEWAGRHADDADEWPYLLPSPAQPWGFHREDYAEAHPA